MASIAGLGASFLIGCLGLGLISGSEFDCDCSNTEPKLFLGSLGAGYFFFSYSEIKHFWVALSANFFSSAAIVTCFSCSFLVASLASFSRRDASAAAAIISSSRLWASSASSASLCSSASLKA